MGPRLTQAERTEISDQKMFDATVALLLEKGPAATSLKEIGLLAGYSRGLANHRFGNKDNLFAFVLQRLAEMWLEQLKKVTHNQTGLAAVASALQQHYVFCVEAPDYVRTFYTLWFESVNAGSALSQMIKNIHQRRHRDVVDWLVNDDCITNQVKQRADDIAGQFCASVIGIVYFWLANPDEIEKTKKLHDNLKHTMEHLITAH